MSKNRLSSIQAKKQEAEEKSRQEARSRMEGKAPWDDEEKAERISMRIEPSLKEAFEKSLPRYARVSDVIRDYMIKVAKQEVEI